MTVDYFPDTAFRQRAHKLIHLDTVAKHLDGWEAANTVRARQFTLALGIDFRHPELAVVFRRELIQDRHEHFAGPAPVGPEIDKDGRDPGGFDDFAGKGFCCHGADERVVTHFGFPKAMLGSNSCRAGQLPASPVCAGIKLAIDYAGP